jgi:hypothetical protein
MRLSILKEPPQHILIFIVTHFLGNTTRKFTWVSDLDKYLLDNRSLHSQIQLFALVMSLDVLLFNVIHSGTTNLGEVTSALLRAQLSLALVGYELASALVGYKLY